MNKILTAAVAALTIAGSVAAVAGPAQAEPYRYSNRHKSNNNNDAGIAIAAGIVGLAIGAAVASSGSNRRNSSYYYDNGYQQQGYGGAYGNSYYGNGYQQPYYSGGYNNAPYSYGQDRYAYAPRVCTSRERVYDRYSGRPSTITRQYAC